LGAERMEDPSLMPSDSGLLSLTRLTRLEELMLSLHPDPYSTHPAHATRNPARLLPLQRVSEEALCELLGTLKGLKVLELRFFRDVTDR
jgi:hypothetical protein